MGSSSTGSIALAQGAAQQRRTGRAHLRRRKRSASAWVWKGYGGRRIHESLQDFEGWIYVARLQNNLCVDDAPLAREMELLSLSEVTSHDVEKAGGLVLKELAAVSDDQLRREGPAQAPGDADAFVDGLLDGHGRLPEGNLGQENKAVHLPRHCTQRAVAISVDADASAAPVAGQAARARLESGLVQDDLLDLPASRRRPGCEGRAERGGDSRPAGRIAEEQDARSCGPVMAEPRL